MRNIISQFLLVIVLSFVLISCRPRPSPVATPGEPTSTAVLTSVPSKTTAIPPTPTSVPPTTMPVLQGEATIVTSSADSGPGSLRQALQDAQPNDTITFDPASFPPDAPVTIFVSSELPHIRVSNLTLDASNAGVILDGSQVPGEWVAGLQIVSAEANTIMGLQISNFPGPGIAISGNAKHNVIGGDRSLGAGPFGQGNMLTQNVIGIDMSTSGATLNTVTGNLIGTDIEGTNSLGNDRDGVSIIEGAHGNIIGSNNIIAYNGRCGVEVEGSDSSGNTLTQNSIHDNGEGGICLLGGGNTTLDAPFITDFDLYGGSLKGTTCVNCKVEIFSDNSDEGATYEGQAVADNSGVFLFNKGSAFTNPNITSTSMDVDGNTSEFSNPAGHTTGVIILQEGNSLPGTWQLTRPSSHLVADTRLGWGLYSSNIWNDIPNLEYLLKDYTDFGVKRLDTSMQEIEEPIDWNRSEFVIFKEYDRFIDALNENGIAVNYMLHFWDKDGRANGEELLTPRFKTDEQIQDFLDYVRFVVSNFKGRVQYYTIWSEPDACGGSQIKCIEPLDYIELARQTIPVIREEDPQAKVVTAPNVLYFDREYLFTVLRSDVIPMFDVISWHGIYDAVPNSEFYGNYYYEYPMIIEEIKGTAAANGFDGEYWGTELTWCSEEFPNCHAPDQPWEMSKTDKIAAKYDARGFVIQLGIDVGVGWGGLESPEQPWSYPTVQRLNTLMAGARPISHAVKIENEPSNTTTYAFELPNGDTLFALWVNGVAEDDNSGLPATLTFPGVSAEKVIGIDVLYGFQQELITERENGNLVIRNLLVKDYPIILRFSDIATP